MNQEKLVIVTGASRGIGFFITQELLKKGFKIHMIADQEKRLKEAQIKLKQHGNVAYSVLNLSAREQIKDFCDQWKQEVFGLVNNAGRWAEERIDEPDKNIWDSIMKLNVEGLYFLTKGLQRWIVNNGRIINIASQLGTSGRAGMGAYAASKHAVIGLTRCWALELGKRAITVNAVCPGWVNTESNRVEIKEWAEEKGLSFENKVKEITDSLALHRFIEPEEVAGLVGFLIGSTGSGITGQVYEIK